MGFRRSEYGREFKQPSWDSQQAQYRELVSYRSYRRQLENHHNFVEWDWDTESEEQLAGGGEQRGGGGGGRGDGRGRTSPVGPPPHTRMGEGAHGRRERYDADEGRAIAARGLTEREVQTPDWGADRPSTDSRGKKRHRTDGHDVELSPRPKTSPGLRGADGGRPPLVAYGWADSRRDVGGKKTYNVRASDRSQVFPAALRAMRRNEYAIKYREEQRRKENLKTRRLRAAFNVPPPDNSVWMTEYQRNFAGNQTNR